MTTQNNQNLSDIKLQAEIEKLQAEIEKLQAETKKITKETKHYPAVTYYGLVGALAGAITASLIQTLFK